MKAILIAALWGSLAWASQIDYSKYELSELQLDLLERFEKNHGFSEEQLIKAAEAFHKSNQPKIPTYIPPHTMEELSAVIQWAAGGAYLDFARDAGVGFDREAYLADCPNVALFQFGKASGTEFLRADVMTAYYNTAYALTRALSRDRESFRDAYLESIMKTEFSKYLIIDPLEFLVLVNR